jgi:hypothetical protein
MDPRGPDVCHLLGRPLCGGAPSGRRDSPAAVGPVVHRGPPRSRRTLPAAGRELRGRSASHRGARPTSVRAACAAWWKGFRSGRAPALERSAHTAHRRGQFHVGESRLSNASSQVRRSSMTPPLWLDPTGRPRPTRACWTCGREVAPMRFRAGDLRPHGRRPLQTLHIPDWCGCTTEYLPVPAGDGWWQLWPRGDVSRPVGRDAVGVDRAPEPDLQGPGVSVSELLARSGGR